jgi:hypothetical protein
MLMIIKGSKELRNDLFIPIIPKANKALDPLLLT